MVEEVAPPAELVLWDDEVLPEGSELFIVREVEPTLARDEEFASHGGFAIVKRDRCALLSSHLGRAKARWTSADNGNLWWRITQGRKVHTYWQIPSATVMVKPELAGTLKWLPAA